MLPAAVSRLRYLCTAAGPIRRPLLAVRHIYLSTRLCRYSHRLAYLPWRPTLSLASCVWYIVTNRRAMPLDRCALYIHSSAARLLRLDTAAAVVIAVSLGGTRRSASSHWFLQSATACNELLWQWITAITSNYFGWWRGVAVTRFIRSTKLLYAGPD